MNPTSLLIFAIPLLVVLAAGLPSVALTEEEPSVEQMIVADARTGEIHVLPLDGAEPDALSSCGGEAPEETYCETGEHPSVWLHGFPTPKPHAGTLESRLIHEDGAQIFRCHYVAGESVLSCTVRGELVPPTAGAIFHDCYVYHLATGGLLTSSPGAGEPTGVPGGLGPWSCLVVE